MSKSTLKWHCGLYIGSPKWRGTDYCEPDECGMEFETEEPCEEIEQMICSTKCPKCGGELNMQDDEPEILNN